MSASDTSTILDNVRESMDAQSNDNYIELDTKCDSRITNVNLYSDRAQITRTYKVDVLAGRNSIRLTSLPTNIDHKCLRVKIRGSSAKIQDVTTFQIDKIVQDTTFSSTLQELNHRKARARETRDRYRRTADLMHSHMNDHTLKHVDASEVGETLDLYDTLQEKWENKLTKAEQELEDVKQEIETEDAKVREMYAEYNRLRTNVAIGVYATEPAELEILLTYMASGVNWKPAYNVRVDMRNPGVLAPVELDYQAYITQSTGENWENVSLVLETAQPTNGLHPLGPWLITHEEPPAGHAMSPVFIPGDSDIESSQGSCYFRDRFHEPEVRNVNSTWEVGTTIKVPGLSTIPTNENERCVNIVKLELEAKISWACVPKTDRKVYLEADITNLSKYTLLPGWASVYAGNSFMSCTEITNAVSPKESFKCPLGADPSACITDYRLEEEHTVVKSGFFRRKKLIHDFTRRISISNTKSLPLYGVRVTDYIHVPNDPDISVTLISPALVPSQSGTPDSVTTTTTDKGVLSLPSGAEVSVSDGVRAMWKGVYELRQVEHGIGDVMVPCHALGQDGTIEWLCDLPAFGRADLVLQWKVTTAQVKKWIYGL